jgi:hypothetical protein
MSVVFKKYVPPAERMNRLLKCVEYVGPARVED